MNILILGAGGREHAFALKLSESKKINQLFVAPGNAGTDKIANNIQVDPTDFKAVRETVLKNNIKMVVVGPEAPLVNGVHDFFLASRAVFRGNGKDARRLDGQFQRPTKLCDKLSCAPEKPAVVRDGRSLLLLHVAAASGRRRDGTRFY